MTDKVQLFSELFARDEKGKLKTCQVEEEEVDRLLMDGYCLALLNEMEPTQCCCGRDKGYWPFFLKFQLLIIIVNSYQICDALLGIFSGFVTVQFGSYWENFSWCSHYDTAEANQPCVTPYVGTHTCPCDGYQLSPVQFVSSYLAAVLAQKFVDKYEEKYNNEEKIAKWILDGDKRTWCSSLKTSIWYISTLVFWVAVTTLIDEIATPALANWLRRAHCDFRYDPLPECTTKNNPCVVPLQPDGTQHYSNDFCNKFDCSTINGPTPQSFQESWMSNFTCTATQAANVYKKISLCCDHQPQLEGPFGEPWSQTCENRTERQQRWCAVHDLGDPLPSLDVCDVDDIRTVGTFGFCSYVEYESDHHTYPDNGRTCWGAYTPDYPSCSGYTENGYTCVGDYCAIMNPTSGTPSSCAQKYPPGFVVDKKLGRCVDPHCAGQMPPTSFTNGESGEMELLSGPRYNTTGPGGLCVMVCVYDSDCFGIGARCIAMDFGASICLFNNTNGKGIIDPTTPSAHFEYQMDTQIDRTTLAENALQPVSFLPTEATTSSGSSMFDPKDQTCWPKNGAGISPQDLDSYYTGNLTLTCLNNQSRFYAKLFCGLFDGSLVPPLNSSWSWMFFGDLGVSCSLQNGLPALPNDFPYQNFCDHVCYEAPVPFDWVSACKEENFDVSCLLYQMVVIDELWLNLCSVISKGWLQSFITFTILYIAKLFICARFGCEKETNTEDGKMLENQNEQTFARIDSAEHAQRGQCDIEMDHGMNYTPLAGAPKEGGTGGNGGTGGTGGTGGNGGNGGGGGGLTARERRRALRRRYLQHTKPYRCCKSDPKVVKRLKKKAVVTVAVTIARKARERQAKALAVAAGTYVATYWEKYERACCRVFGCCRCCRKLFCDGDDGEEWWNLVPKKNYEDENGEEFEQVVEYMRGAPPGSKELVERMIEEVKQGRISSTEYSTITRALLRAADRAKIPKKVGRSRKGARTIRNGNRTEDNQAGENVRTKIVARKNHSAAGGRNGSMSRRFWTVTTPSSTASSTTTAASTRNQQRREANRILANMFSSRIGVGK